MCTDIGFDVISRFACGVLGRILNLNSELTDLFIFLIIHLVLSLLITIALRRPLLLLTILVALLIVAVPDVGSTTEGLAQLSPGNPP